MTLKELVNSTHVLRPNPIPSIPARNVSIIRYNLNMDNLTLLVEGNVVGSGNTNYTVDILFLSAEVNPVLISDTIEIPLVRGTEKTTILLRRLKEAQTDVQVSCVCSDYQFTFSYVNNEKGAHYNGVIPYKRKTTTYAPRNPKKINGL